MNKIMHIYETLLSTYGKQGWWPVTPKGGSRPRYGEPVRTKRQRFEVVLGAILTQNTSWKNAESAIINLNRHGLVDAKALAAMSADEIAPLIRSARYYNQKAKKIKAYLDYKGPIEREGLLGIWGLGPETVDSMLLYAFGIPSFVVDAYTRRYFSALGCISADAPYDTIKAVFETAVSEALDATGDVPAVREKRRGEIYNEYHALIVEHAKQYYSRKPYGVNDPTV